VIFATPYLSTIPSTFKSVVPDFVFLNSDIFPFNFVTVVLKGIGRFLSSKEKTALFILIGPISIFVVGVASSLVLFCVF
jgi:hypothetical protein